MKNTVRLFGIIAIVAVIGFSMAGCDEEEEAQTYSYHVYISPGSATVQKGGTQTFTATVKKEGGDVSTTSGVDQTVTWSVEAGSISGYPNLHAGTTITQAGVLTVSADQPTDQYNANTIFVIATSSYDGLEGVTSWDRVIVTIPNN
jgi:hypothetical protein